MHKWIFSVVPHICICVMLNIYKNHVCRFDVRCVVGELNVDMTRIYL